MKLSRIYRDIYSTLNVDREEIPIHSKDVINCINDVIATSIPEYVNRGLGDVFSVLETVYGFSPDTKFSNIYSAKLDFPINQDIDKNVAITASFFKEGVDLKNESGSASLGEIRYKAGHLYKCVESYNGVNTFELTFKPEGASQFYPDNGLYYFEDDVVFDVDTETWWRATQDYENTIADDIEDTNAFEQLYWKRIGGGSLEGNLSPSKSSVVLGSSIGTYMFYLDYNRVYANDNKPLVLEYVPEWQDEDTLNNEINIPRSMAENIKLRCVEILRSKFMKEEE
jgi:hypothetical protein